MTNHDPHAFEQAARDEAARHAAIDAARPIVADRLDYRRNMERITAFLERHAARPGRRPRP